MSKLKFAKRGRFGRGTNSGPKYREPFHNYRARKDLTISCFIGRRGSGKTASMVHMADLINRYGNHGRPILSNIEVSFADFCHPAIHKVIQNSLKPDRYGNTPPSKWRGGLVLIDEIADLIPSIRPNSKTMIEFTNIFRSIRKNQMDIMMTCQFPQEIVGVGLRQVDFFIAPKLKRFETIPTPGGGVLRNHLAVQLKWFNWSGHITGHPRHGEKFSWVYSRPDMVEWRPHISGVFNKYETDEIVYSPYTDVGKQALEDSVIMLDDIDDQEELAKMVRDLGGSIPVGEFVDHVVDKYGEDNVTSESIQEMARNAGLVSSGRGGKKKLVLMDEKLPEEKFNFGGVPLL